MSKLTFNQIITKISFFLATGCYSGYLPKAPGTFGSLVCIPVWYLCNFYFPNCDILLLTIVSFLGLFTSQRCLNELKKSDPSVEDPAFIVIDEWAGILIPLHLATFVNYSPWFIFFAFVLFRFFDISKWWLVGKAEKLPGAIGIMADDLIAGLFAALLMIFGLFGSLLFNFLKS